MERRKLQGMMEKYMDEVGSDNNAVLGGRFLSRMFIAFVGCDMIGCVHHLSPSAGIAQLVEHLVAIQKVASSNLVSRSILFSQEK
jgi:hypothetical protein